MRVWHFIFSFVSMCVLPTYGQNANKNAMGSYAYWEMDIGFAYPIFMNNQYSKKMINPFATNSYFRTAAYFDQNKSFGLGIMVGGYDYGQNDQNYKEVISNLVSENGPLSFGDIFLNDFTEWDFGLFVSYVGELKAKWSLISSIGGGLMYSSRRQQLYEYNNDTGFVYNVNSRGNNGYFITGDFGINYLLVPKWRGYIGLSYEMTYGRIPVNYEVRYGIGDDISVYNSYQYVNDFTVWRHRLKLSLRFDFSIFY